jgi:DNA topoisomerase-1
MSTDDRTAVRRLARTCGLTLLAADKLSWRRERRGKGFAYLDDRGRVIRDATTRTRLNALAVPPAYVDVRLAADPCAHLQATGRDEAGRLQYRYHPQWVEVREVVKAKRLLRFLDALPRIRRCVGRDLAAPPACYRHALAAAIRLVERTAIRAGCESYLKTSGSRGAATLLKSNVRIDGASLRLAFRAKGGKWFERAMDAPALAQALAALQDLPGRRLFQYRDDEGRVRALNARDLNDYLQAAAGAPISMKDFRTLLASATAAERLADTAPAASESGRRRQILEVVRDIAGELSNTPTVARKSYVHATVVAAFENGSLHRLSGRVSGKRLSPKREMLLRAVVGGA